MSKDFADALRVNTSLTSLDFSGMTTFISWSKGSLTDSNINGDGAKALAETLKISTWRMQLNRQDSNGPSASTKCRLFPSRLPVSTI